MASQQDVLDYFNKHGFYIVTSPGQQEAVDELVQEGILRPVEQDWFCADTDASTFYVHSSVDCKAKMPVALWKLIIEQPDFYIREVVNVWLQTSQGNSVQVRGEVTRHPWLQNNGTKTIEVCIERNFVIVPVKDVHRTFRIE